MLPPFQIPLIRVASILTHPFNWGRDILLDLGAIAYAEYLTVNSLVMNDVGKEIYEHAITLYCSPFNGPFTILDF
jgi:hypothetical protein